MPSHGKLNSLKLKERIGIHEILKTVCAIPDGSMFVVYKEGWTDDRVAQKAAVDFNVAVTRWNVSSVRAEMIGNLNEPKGRRSSAKIEALMVQIERLKARVSALEDTITTPPTNGSETMI